MSFDLSYDWGGLGDFSFSTGPFSGSGATSSASVQDSLTGGLNATLQGWLSGVAQADVARRVTKVQRQDVDRMSEQNPGNTPDMTTRGAQALGGMRVGDLLPLVILGGLAYFLLKKA